MLFSLQLGQELGTKGVHHDGPQQEEQLWYRHLGQLPCRLELYSLCMNQILSNHSVDTFS